MSGGERKRVSKWDLQDGVEQQDSLLDENIHKNPSSSFENSGSHPEFYVTINNDSKNEHGGEVLDASMPWDSARKISPDKRKSNHSPQSGFGTSNRSRSRSRSPSISNSISIVRPSLNRDEASRNMLPNDSRENASHIGRSNTQNYNVCNNFLKGRSFRGESCRYSHHRTDDGISEESSKNFSFRTKNESSGRFGPPCRYFSSGNCRNGKSCHFSHNQQTSEGPDDMLRDNWRRQNSNLNDVKQSWESKLNHHHLSTNGDSIIKYENGLAQNPSLNGRSINLTERQNSSVLLAAPAELNCNEDSCQQPILDGTKNSVSKEQISQLSNLSVCLAQFFGSGKQLPLLYAAVHEVSNSDNAAVPPDLTQNQYDPVVNNVSFDKSEAKKVESTNKLDVKVVHEDKGKEDKSNNGKERRAFKFALVEFVKELLKPKWKEGQLSKEDHKIIVKKVVDKVTGSIQGVHIPQSPDKIDNYLSSSKPKLSKLVQAYVEKYQKS